MIASSNLKNKVWHYQVSGKQSFNGLRTSLVGKSAESLSFLKKNQYLLVYILNWKHLQQKNVISN